MKSTKPQKSPHLSPSQARRLIELIGRLIERLLTLQEGLYRAYLPEEFDAHTHGWDDHIPF